MAQITQERIDAFAGATDDPQWIHIDPERAASGPFGGTIAHGFLTLSLCVPFLDEVLPVGGIALFVNYGVNRVRVPRAGAGRIAHARQVQRRVGRRGRRG